jgi:hypothetical protein
MPPVGFEPTIPAGERPQTQVLDRAATGITFLIHLPLIIIIVIIKVKLKVTLEQATKAQSGSRGIALLFL